MNPEALDALAQKLHEGDAESAELLFREYEPFLRMVVRRRLSPALRPKFDSADIVQSVMADVFHGLQKGDWQFADSRHLRAFLVKAAKNRLVDRARQQRRALANERPLGDAPAENAVEPHARPSQQVQANDVWRQMLAACPPAHRDILSMKRDGFSLDEIAQRTGMHRSSVRRILYELARRVTQS